jgi:hypothetical protein
MPSIIDAGGEADPMINAALQVLGGADQHRVHDRRAAVVRHAMLADGLEHRQGLDAAQADVGASHRRDGPRKAPAIAVEHGQRP